MIGGRYNFWTQVTNASNSLLKTLWFCLYLWKILNFYVSSVNFVCCWKSKITKSDLLRKLGIPNFESTPIIFIDLSLVSWHKHIMGTHIILPQGKKKKKNLIFRTKHHLSWFLINNLKEIPQSHQTLHLSSLSLILSQSQTPIPYNPSL